MDVLPSDWSDRLEVTQPPELMINLIFFGESFFESSPFTDKLRTTFVNFYSPFLYTDPLLYDPKARIKYWNVNCFIPNVTTFFLLFCDK
jgi:hypothetical protein